MGHATVVGFMISLAAGYWLLTLAEKEGGLVKTLGRVLAGIIIVVSLLGPVFKLAGAFYRHSHGDGCGFAMGRHGHGGGWGHGPMGQDGACCAQMGQGMACPMPQAGKDGMAGMKHEGKGHMDHMKDQDSDDKAAGQ